MNNVIETKPAPRLPDKQLLRGLKGYGVPINDKKAGNVSKGLCLAEGFLKNLRIQSEIDFIQRYKWYGLEDIGMDQELLERMLYYRYQVGLFLDDSGEFLVLPYVLKDTIDIYGRYTEVSFLPFNGRADVKDPKKNIYIPGEGRKPQYNILLPEELDEETIRNSCVLLTDYSRQISQNGIPQAQLQEAFMSMEAELYPMARTALLSQTGIRAIKVSNGNQAESVEELNQSIYSATQEGNMFLAFTGDALTEQLGAVPAASPEEYLLYLQSLENQRLAGIGLENGGIFQKKAHELQSESDMMSGNSSRIYQDGLQMRQKWCLICRSIYPWLNLWCEPAEVELQLDENGDGKIDNGDVNPDVTEGTGGTEDADV